jgi:hypothetical protein
MFVTARCSPGCCTQALRHTTTERMLNKTSHGRMSKMSEAEPVSIGRFDVHVKSYFDLNAIGILDADITLGRGHSFGLTGSADVAAVIQIDFNNKPITL